MIYVTRNHPRSKDVWALCASGVVVRQFPGRLGEYAAKRAALKHAEARWAVVAAADEGDFATWTSDAIAFLNTPTSDRRQYEAPVRFRDFPQPLSAQFESSWGHDGAIIVGRIDQMSVSGDSIPASGIIDAGLEEGATALRMARNEMLTGISIDIAAIDGMEVEFVEFDDDGYPVEYLDHYIGFEISGATLCTQPAFADARITIVSEPAAAEPVAASGEIPVTPPVAWFEDPHLQGRTRLTVTDEGQVFGHLGPWGECHIGIQGRCQEVPHSASDYGWFQLGTLKCEEGCRIPIGTIVMDTGHADRHASARVAASHYDNTGTAIADIAVGEDEHGVWVAGALRSTATPEQLRAFEASRLSGDWRPINGDLELIAILAVNFGGFPVWEEAVAADGSIESLIASVGPDERPPLHATAAWPATRDEALRHALAPVLSERAEALAGRIHR